MITTMQEMQDKILDDTAQRWAERAAKVIKREVTLHLTREKREES